MSTPNLKAGRAKPNFGKASSPATPKGESAGGRASTKTRKDGIPILFASNEAMPGAVSFSQWAREIHPVLRIKYPRVADQIVTRERNAPVEPLQPETIDPLPVDATEEQKSRYALELAVYLDDRKGYRESHAAWQKDIKGFVQEERQTMGFISTYTSEILQGRVLEHFEDYSTSNDLIKLFDILERHHRTMRATNSRGLRIAAEKALLNMSMTAGQSLLSYYRAYHDAAQHVVDCAGRDLSPASHARVFLNGLDRRWTPMMVEKANEEAEAEVTGSEDDPYPQDLQTAYGLASARVLSKTHKETDDVKVSTLNKAVGRGADSQGKGGGNREAKTHAAKPSASGGKAKSSGECHTCDGELNCLTDDKPHFSRDCPISKMDVSEKSKLITKLKGTSKSTGHAKSTISRAKDEDSDDDDCVTFSTITGYARPIVMTARRKTFDPYDFQLDNGANVKVITTRSLLTNIRANPKHGIDGVETAGGVVSYTEIGDNPILGTCYYDPSGAINILPYAFVCRCFHVYGHRSDPREPEEYYEVTFPTGVATFPLTKDDIYVANLKHIFKQNRGHSVMRVVANMSEKQRKDAEHIRGNMQRFGFQSLEKLYVSVRDGYLRNTSFTADDVRRAIALGPTSSHADIAVRQGKRVQRPVHSLRLGDKLGERELVLHGDLFFLFSIPFLLLVSEPGGYAAVEHLPKGRKSKSLFQEIKEVVHWFSSHNWRVRVISFDGEGGISASAADIRGLGIEVVVYPTDTCDPIAEAKIRRIKERARSIRMYVLTHHGWPLNMKLVPWLGVASAARMNETPTVSNPNSMPPLTFITGKEIDFRRHCVAGFGDSLEVKAPITALNPSNSLESRTQSAIALMADVQGHWWVFLIRTMRFVKREISTYDLMPTSDAVRLRMEELAKDHPLRGGEADDVLVMTDDSLSEEIRDSSAHDIFSEEIRDSSAHTIRAEESGVDAAVAASETVPSENYDMVQPSVLEASDHLVEENNDDAPSNLLENDVDDDDDDPGEDIDTAESHAPPVEPPSVVKFKRRPITRGLGKATRSGHVYSAVKKNMLFSAAGVLSLKKGLAEYGEEARKALITEIDNMVKRKVWTGVLRSSLSKSQRKAIIRSHAFLKEKLSPSNVFLRLKARLVAMGNMQDRTLYTPEETSSPTVAQSSAYVVLAVAANERRHVMSFDVGSAYLHADMPGEVVMELDPITTAILTKLDPTFSPFVDEDGKVLVRLNKALYGCVESAKAWYRHLKRSLEKLGYVANEYDPCVFNRWTESGFQSTVFFHVDDGIATCEDELELDKLEGELRAEFGEMNVTRGKRHEFLGLVLDFSKDGVVAITAPRLIGEILEDFGISGTSRVPASVDLFEIDIDSPLLSEAQRRKFHGGVQKLLYIAGKCRMDISVPVNFLTTRVTIATEQDMKKLTKTLRYLNGTRDLGLMLGGDEQGFISVQIFADASYGVHVDGKSHSGVAVTLGRGAILIHSGKQRLVVKSSAEAELVTQADSLGYGFRILNFIKAQGYDIDQGIIHQDNQAAIRLAENGRSTSNRTRHIKIRYFFLKQFLDSGELQVVYCPTDKMVADILTKPLQGEIFAKGRSYLLGYDSP